MKNKLILEFSEFNLQRMNSDSVRPSIHVDDPQLSTNAFDKHQSSIRSALARINGILFNIKGSSSYNKLKSSLSISDQDIQSLKILRILKSDSINYDVYVTFFIKDEEYWGKISNILSKNPNFKSEVFKERSLIQTKEWEIKIKGLIIQTIKKWLSPDISKYSVLNSDIICYSIIDGSTLYLKKNQIIDVVNVYYDRIIFDYRGNQYSLSGDNYIYFNWWFEKIKE